MSVVAVYLVVCWLANESSARVVLCWLANVSSASFPHSVLVKQ